MNTYKQDMHLSILLWIRDNAVACSMLAVLALAILCSTPSKAQCVVGTNAALQFDGVDDRCATAATMLADGFQDFLIEAWIRSSATANLDVIIDKRNPGTSRPYWLGIGTGGVPQLSLNHIPAATTNLFGPYSVVDGLWHHIAAGRSGSLVSLYVDGVLVASGTFALALYSVNAPIHIGRCPDQHQFSGDIDEIRIWNVARTQAQIQAAMNVGLTGTEPGLVGYWRFDEGSGQTVFNSAVATGSALDGTLGANALPGTDDPTWISNGLPPLPYCPPCPTPPCGQVNSPCATLTVNGVGAGAQGPLNVAAPAGSTLSLNWIGPQNQPYVLVATPNLIPGQVVAPPSFVVDVNIGSFAVVLSGFDPFLGPLFFTSPTGSSSQAFAVPSVLLGSVLNVQGLIYDLANTCSGGVGLATTASFSIQF